MSGEKISSAEMIELFGDEMPIEAINLLWNAPGDKTIGEVRDELRQLAEKRSMPQSNEPLVEAIAEVLWSRLDMNGHTREGVRRAAQAALLVMGTIYLTSHEWLD